MDDKKEYRRRYWATPTHKIKQQEHAQKYNRSGKYVIKKEEYRVRNALFVANYKTSCGCLLCDEDCAASLDFHHINGDKEHDISAMVAMGLSIETILKEITKCVVLCRNCHAKVEAGIIVFG